MIFNDLPEVRAVLLLGNSGSNNGGGGGCGASQLVMPPNRRLEAVRLRALSMNISRSCC